METVNLNKQYIVYNVRFTPHHPAEKVLYALRRGRVESLDCNKQYTLHNVSCTPHHPAKESLFKPRRGRVETVNFHKHTQCKMYTTLQRNLSMS